MDLEGRINCKPIQGSASEKNPNEYEFFYFRGNEHHREYLSRSWQLNVPGPIALLIATGAAAGLLYGAWIVTNTR